jgi:hypothetical protein
MSWFEYGTPRRRTLRKGVWLRKSSLSENILNIAQNYINDFGLIEYVIVKEIRKNNRVYLEFWCKEERIILNSKKRDNFTFPRNIVFGFEIEENPKWICEGDLGRGYKE